MGNDHTVTISNRRKPTFVATPLPLDEQLRAAGQLVVRARIFYDIWWFYQGEDTRPKIKDTMNVYSEYFLFDDHAHFVSFIIHIAALFEGRRDSINLPNLTKKLSKSQLVSADVVANIDPLLLRASEIKSKVSILRNKLFAHRNASMSYAEIFEEASICANDLRDLTEIAFQVANRLLVARGNPEVFINRFPVMHASQMLNVLAAAENEVGAD